MSMFMDGDRVTPGTERCVCGPDCEFPCWQRIGLTETPCCKGCAPLGDDDYTPEDIAYERANHRWGMDGRGAL